MMARVLLVEDESNLRMLYRLELQSQGTEIIEAASGAEAVRVLESDCPVDAVILDLNLPDVRGWQLLNLIAACRPQVPVIINTAYGNFREEPRYRGAAAYVVKSADLSPLKNALARCLAACRQRERENVIEFRRARFE
jgi:DNA-binding NtrC family response regulator